ncbi:MAG: nitrogen regulation protein NR(II) [Thermomicrobiales bacterium]
MSNQVQFSSDSRLRESEQRYRDVIQGASDLIQSIRPDGSFEFVNRAWLEKLGYSEEELTGLTIWDVIHPSAVDECQIHFGQVMSGHDLQNIRVLFQTKSGEAIPAEGSAHSRFIDGELVATHGFFRDISERLRLEQLASENRKLEEAERARYQEKMAALGKLSAGLSHELNNPAAAAARSVRGLLQALHARDEAQRSMIRLQVSLEVCERIAQVAEKCEAERQQARHRSALEMSRLEDEIGIWLEAHGVAESWNYAQPLVSGGISTSDLEDLAGLMSAESFESAVTWIAESLVIREALDVVIRSTDRISELVGAVKAYSFRDQATEQDVDIHDGIENTLVILAYQLKGMKVERNYDHSIPKVRTYGSGLNQVWTNILDNAADATNGSGTVSINTRREGDLAVIEIADDGPGIPAEVLTRIFEPFYTTKPQGSGTGLGLDIVWRIVVDEHGGSIDAESEPGRTVFRVSVPLCPDVRQRTNGAAEI